MKLEVRQALGKEEGRATEVDMGVGFVVRARRNTSEYEATQRQGLMLLEKGLDAMLWERTPDWFNKDSNFAQAVQQALGLAQQLTDAKHENTTLLAHLGMCGASIAAVPQTWPVAASCGCLVWLPNALRPDTCA